MTKANDRQVGGEHYSKASKAIQHWDFAAAQNFDYFQGQITKYVARWKDKNGIIDLEKALHFLEKYIEVEKVRMALSHGDVKDDPKFRGARLMSELPKHWGAEGTISVQQQSPFGFDAKQELGSDI